MARDPETTEAMVAADRRDYHRDHEAGTSCPGGVNVEAEQPPQRMQHSGASNSFTIRLKLKDTPEMLGLVTTAIGKFGVPCVPDPVAQEEGFAIWDLTLYLEQVSQIEALEAALKLIDGVTIVNTSDRVFRCHLGGKIKIESRVPVQNRDDLSMVYTPGVARVCTAIAQNPDKAWTLTGIGNTIAVVSDGSRVLSLGNIGAHAALPVMEGKAILFQRFGGVNAVPIVLSTQDPKEIIRTVQAIAPSFGGINLEDIASPGCWEVENKLKETLGIPVFHDDQHGTAVVVLAATINAAKLVKKQLRHLRVVVSGVGAAGMACCRLLVAAGVRNIIGFKREGAVWRGRPDLNEEEKWLAENSNPKNIKCCLKDALKGADMFLGLSVAGVIQGKDLRGMRRDPIVFALANPVPEVMPEDALQHGAVVVATGGSEYPNQINNALAFPGIFRGALDCRVSQITHEMKMESARALANVIPRDRLRANYIIPSIFDDRVHKAVAAAVTKVAHATGLARRAKRTR